MLLFICAILLLVLFLFFIRPLFSKLPAPEKLIAYFVTGSAYIIVSLETASLFSGIEKPFVILLIQSALSAAALLIFRKKLVIPSKESTKTSIASTLERIKKHPYVSTYIFLIAVTYAFLFFLSVYFPQNTGDSLYNHLSRIGYWLQQGSLKPYNGFNDVGATYPYNNSLLMMWSVIFLRSDLLVGGVQFIATLVCALIIYRMAVELGFNSIRSLIAGLVFLTFPIILFQSITAQNDTLAASYIAAAFMFLIGSIRRNQKINLVLSGLAFGLALGTKQYAFFTLPGYLALVIMAIIKARSQKWQALYTWTASMLVFTAIAGSYGYIQNAVYNRPVLGEVHDVNYSVVVNPPKDMFQKSVINSARLATQFISCDGLIPGLEKYCYAAKGVIFRALFVNQRIDIESSDYLLEQETPFSLTTPYSLNEESAWFGPLSWLLILPGLFYGIFFSIKHKRIEAILLLLTCLIFFVAIASFKNGWDPFLGRHLIAFVVLLMPFTGFIFGQKGWFSKTVLAVICSASILIVAYAIINNDSRPLLGKSQFYGKNWSDFTPVEKFAYRFLPLVKHDANVWGLSREELRAYSDLTYLEPLVLVEQNIPSDAVLGISAKQGYFNDYLFFGERFGRKVVPIKNGDIRLQPDFVQAEYLLITPEYYYQHPFGFKLIAEEDQWRILKRIPR